MLADKFWQSVAVFAATCAQSRSLNLAPWQSPLFRASLPTWTNRMAIRAANAKAPSCSKSLLDANLSPFEPDPARGDCCGRGEAPARDVTTPK